MVNGSSSDTGSPRRVRRSKAQHFSDEAEKRVNFLLEHMDRLGKLSSRATNTYSEQQIQAISRALSGKLESTLAKFSNGHSSGFKMPANVDRPDPPPPQ